MQTTQASQTMRTRQTLELNADHRLEVERDDAGDLLRLFGPGGCMKLSIAITRDGPVLEFEGSGLSLRSAGTVAIEARRVAIHGREGVEISSGADARIAVAGELESTAAAQTLRATLGDVKLRANDDLRLNGERVLLNC